MRLSVTHAWLPLLFSFKVHSSPALLSDAGPLPLSPGQSAHLFNQCSRPAPAPEGLIWQPSAKEIAQLEGDLPGYLSALQEKGKSVPGRPPSYRGQYVYYTDHGQPRVYAAFVPEEEVRDDRVAPGNAYVVCGGGPMFWGVIYNPATRSFNDLQFNGPK
jgi:hypothetical protein